MNTLRFYPVNNMSELDVTRKGPYIQTTKGNLFWPMDPRIGDFDIEVIASKLANTPRFGGFLEDPDDNFNCVHYSVAQHSVLIAEAAPVGYKLEALLHDKAEGYFYDITRPHLVMFPELDSYLSKLDLLMATQFDLPTQMSSIVKKLDDSMLVTEAIKFYVNSKVKWWEKYGEPLNIKITPWTNSVAKNKFMNLFYTLTDCRL